MNQDPSKPAGAHFATALQHHQAGRLNEAERDYRQVLDLQPNHADALHFLGVLAHQTQRLALAEELITRAIKLSDKSPVFHNNLGNVFQAQGRWSEAGAAYESALRLKPDYAGAWFNLGLTLHGQERLAQAAAAYTRAIECRPDYAEAHCNLGNVLQAQGRRNEALSAYRKALALRPTCAHAYGNMANVLKALGAHEAALSAYHEALRLLPTYVEAHNNRAVLLLDMDRVDDAADACRTALTVSPESADTYAILGNALREQGRVAECLAAYAHALQLMPQHAEARLGLTIGVLPIYVNDSIESQRSVSEFSSSLEELAHWHAAHPGALGRAVGITQPFYLAYRPDNVLAPLSRYGDLMCAAVCGPPADASANGAGRRDRFRLAIVCGQVREHPVWDMILRGIVRHRDRSRIELSIYHTGARVDDQTQWAAKHVDHFVQGTKPTAAWMADIEHAAPDAIFYPEIGMDPAAFALAAHRLAPHQLAGWGHPVTTGLPTIDCYVSGELLEAENADAHYRERLARLPGTGVCTEPPDAEAGEWQAPGRSPNVVRFALCQQPIKFDPADDASLAQIAKTVGPSEFWLVAPQRHRWATALLHERLARAFRAEGLDPDDYLRVTPWMPRPKFSSFLDAMDISLDCPAFSGFTTAWQAAHRGLPIVTLEGPYLRQRLAAGLLRQIDQTDGICATTTQYVEVATRWAAQCRDRGRWTARRHAMALAAPRADHHLATVRAFERLLLDA